MTKTERETEFVQDVLRRLYILDKKGGTMLKGAKNLPLSFL